MDLEQVYALKNDALCRRIEALGDRSNLDGTQVNEIVDIVSKGYTVGLKARRLEPFRSEAKRLKQWNDYSTCQDTCAE